ncbi:MAG: arylesterase [Caldilineaceae bacterium]|nr:arylesterase [Caldilineaceae bacterium]
MKMNRFWIFGVVLALVVACAPATPAPTATPLPTVVVATPEPAGIIVAMGDSLTEGLGVNLDDAYPAQLARKLQADGYSYTVINAGVSGETTTGALARVDWVLTLQPDIVILATGGNDSLRAIDPKVTQENLRQLVQAFHAADVTVVLAGMQTVQNLGEEYTNAFRAIYPAVAAEYNLILIPFFLEGVAGDPTLNQADFIHPTAAGYTQVVETIYPYVLQAIAALPAE